MRTKVPLLGDLPVVGPLLFQSKDVRTSKTELILFITPRILTSTGHLPEAEEKKLKERFLTTPARRQEKVTSPTCPSIIRGTRIERERRPSGKRILFAALLLWLLPAFGWAQVPAAFYNLTGIKTRKLSNAVQLTLQTDGAVRYQLDYTSVYRDRFVRKRFQGGATHRGPAPVDRVRERSYLRSPASRHIPVDAVVASPGTAPRSPNCFPGESAPFDPTVPNLDVELRTYIPDRRTGSAVRRSSKSRERAAAPPSDGPDRGGARPTLDSDHRHHRPSGLRPVTDADGSLSHRGAPLRTSTVSGARARQSLTVHALCTRRSPSWRRSSPKSSGVPLAVAAGRARRPRSPPTSSGATLAGDPQASQRHCRDRMSRPLEGGGYLLG